DSLITIPNQKLLPVLGHNVSLMDAFKAANNVLLEAVQGITELIVHPGMINVDFADVRTVMKGMGAAIMGTGSATGDQRAREAAEKAIACPLLEDINLQGAKGILVNITASDMGIAEFNEVGQIVHEFASEDAIIKIGTAIDPSLGDELKVTVVATGMGLPRQTHKAPVKLMQKAAAGEVSYNELDKPTVMRNKPESREARFGAAAAAKETNLEYLDIPAFLRRQAD
ncbi:MAG: cell division protein FtsZ, partial [Methylococcaceae bacterium]|nr:cell division protein FtsZ [Methylococcaceae bacterium]